MEVGGRQRRGWLVLSTAHTHGKTRTIDKVEKDTYLLRSLQIGASV